VTLVFELRAPSVLDAVGADNAGARPGGVAGGAVRELAFEGSPTGPESGYAPLAVLELQPDERRTVPVTHAGPVRWIRVTVRSDHGGGTYAYLDEIIAVGEQPPPPSDDGRFGGVFRARGDVVYEIAQEGTLLRGCYTGTSERGGGTMSGSVSDGVARLQWIDGTNPAVRGAALFVIDSRQRLNGVWTRDRSRSAMVGVREDSEPSRCPAGETNPVAAALEAAGEAILYGIYFDFDRDVLKPESEPVLRQVLEALEASPDISVDVEGHTDAVGSDDYNRELSERRARSVVAWLVEHGIAAERLAAVGRGESEPVASNDTADGRALNRRVELRRK
jgi:outer membrane protein OmpA-like peptidoglycan-associated protein